MKRVFEAQANHLWVEFITDEHSHHSKMKFNKGDMIILEDNKIDGWKLLPKNDEDRVKV